MSNNEPESDLRVDILLEFLGSQWTLDEYCDAVRCGPWTVVLRLIDLKWPDRPPEWRCVVYVDDPKDSAESARKRGEDIGQRRYSVAVCSAPKAEDPKALLAKAVEESREWLYKIWAEFPAFYAGGDDRLVPLRVTPEHWLTDMAAEVRARSGWTWAPGMAAVGGYRVLEVNGDFAWVYFRHPGSTNTSGTMQIRISQLPAPDFNDPATMGHIEARLSEKLGAWSVVPLYPTPDGPWGVYRILQPNSPSDRLRRVARSDFRQAAILEAYLSEVLS